jgi:hypothetical protein
VADKLAFFSVCGFLSTLQVLSASLIAHYAIQKYIGDQSGAICEIDFFPRKVMSKDGTIKEIVHNFNEAVDGQPAINSLRHA